MEGEREGLRESGPTAMREQRVGGCDGGERVGDSERWREDVVISFVSLHLPRPPLLSSSSLSPPSPTRLPPQPSPPSPPSSPFPSVSSSLLLSQPHFKTLNRRPTPFSKFSNSPRYSEAGDNYFDNYSRFDFLSMHDTRFSPPRETFLYVSNVTRGVTEKLSPAHADVHPFLEAENAVEISAGFIESCLENDEIAAPPQQNEDALEHPFSNDLWLGDEDSSWLMDVSNAHPNEDLTCQNNVDPLNKQNGNLAEYSFGGKWWNGDEDSSCLMDLVNASFPAEDLANQSIIDLLKQG
ncbi:hypothetical protein Drorol1_Dr00012598 [Drosera rotundifolia]